MNKVSQTILGAAEKNDVRIFHSQPLPRNYSTIAKAQRLVGVTQLQLAFIDAVVAKESRDAHKAR